MREIKFRAWDVELKVMLPWETILDEIKTEGVCMFDSIFSQDYRVWARTDTCNWNKLNRGDYAYVLGEGMMRGVLDLHYKFVAGRQEENIRRQWEELSCQRELMTHEKWRDARNFGMRRYTDDEW